MDWPRLGDRFRASSSTFLLLLILAVALGLRLYGIDWDQGHGYHPDERSIYMRADCMYRVLTEAPGYANGDCFRNNPGMEPGLPGIGAFLDADKSPLNPHWFPLGSILIYLLLGFRFLLEPFTDLDSLLRISYVGRSIMALADVGTVFLVYLLGKRIYGNRVGGKRVGLLAAALVTLAVVHIQNSHFYRPEPLLILFLAASFWFMLQMMERRRLRDSALLGLFVGLTFATKVSVLPLALPLILAYGFRPFSTSTGGWRVPSERETARVLGEGLLAGLVAMAVFFFTTPYALLDVAEFVDDITYQATNVARTAGKVPFTVQYIGATPFLYELKQTSFWAMGLPLGVVAWAGLLFTIFRAGRVLLDSVLRASKQEQLPTGELLLLAWVVPNVILLSLFETKFLRYIFPVIPFLILMGSGMLFWLMDRARALPALAAQPGGQPGKGTSSIRGLLFRYAPQVATGVTVFVVAATVLYALAFESIYTRPHTAIQASEWINENVPKGSTIISDNHWDEPIRDIYDYKVKQIPIYRHDTPEKMNTIAEYLSQGDYLVFYSNRTYGSVARLPERYPMSSRYYRMLFSGELGYRPERAFTSYPEVLGVAFVDDTFGRAGIPEPEALKFDGPPLALNLGYADENVMDYDHPKVLLLRNVEGLSQTGIYDLLTGQDGEPPQPGLMLSAEQKAVQRAGGTWSDIINRDSWANKVPVLAWLLLVELIYLAALPLAIFLFRPLPDRGIILARLLGILGVAYVAWLMASLGWVGFSPASVLAGVAVVASFSGLVLATRWRECTEFLRGNWRLLTIGEVLFLAAFLSFVAVRMANPDLWHPFRGGEKPMDFAYLNAVLRSTSMPPYDPWFAGGYLNYYYYGHFIVATLIKGTGIVPSVAYNLAVPLLFALTVTGAYSLVYNLTAGVRRLSLRPSATPLNPPLATGDTSDTPLNPPLAMGDTSDTPLNPPLAMGDTSDTPLNPPLAMGDTSDTPLNPPLAMGDTGGSGVGRRWARGVEWGPVGAGILAGLLVAVIGNMDGLAQVVKGGWNTLLQGTPFPSLDYLADFWRSSRMLPVSEAITPSALTFWLPDQVRPEMGHHITEFPFFSFLFADLHAHMIAIPFTLLALGLALSLLVGLRTAGRGWTIPTTVALATVVGSLWAINSWDYPTYLLLAVLSIGAGVYLRHGKLGKRLAIFAALSAGVVLLSVLAFLPFHMNYHPFPTGIDVSRWRTPILNYLGIHALFFFLIGTFLIYLMGSHRKELLGSLVGSPSTFLRSGASPVVLIRSLPWGLMAVAAGAVVIVYMAAAGYWTVVLLSLVLAPTVWATGRVLVRREEGAAYALFPLVLVALALLIGIVLEFVRVKDDIGRMNTLFKFYLEAWVFFAMASAYVLWYLGARGIFRLKRPGSARATWLVALVILLGASFIYPVLGSKSRLADRFDTGNMTLDGADYMKTAVHRERGIDHDPIELRWDYDAIRWLQDNVKGSPVVLEAHNEQYNWSSRIADYTGLPTVLGWPWHQIQQRMEYERSEYNYPVGQRRADVTEMYSTQDLERALELLRSYEVEYVVVGELEQVYYPAAGLRKFDSMVGGGMAKLVYQNQGVKIYQGLW